MRSLLLFPFYHVGYLGITVVFLISLRRILTLTLLNLMFDIIPVPPNTVLTTGPLPLNSCLATDTFVLKLYLLNR